MFEEFQEAALKQEKKKKIKAILNIATAILFSVTLVLFTLYTN